MRRSRLSVLLFAAVALACGDRGPAPASMSGARVFRDVQWSETFVIGGTLEDTVLVMPRLIAAGADILYVYDYADHRLKAFDRQGRTRWAFGGAGGGPGEFTNPMDLEVGPSGDAWVLDGALGRITIVSPAGELLELLNFEGTWLRDVIPLHDRMLTTPIAPGNVLWRAYDRAGRTVGEGAYPLPDLEGAHFLARQTYTTVAHDGRAWVAIFPFGSPILVHEGQDLRCHGRLIEAGPFPEQPGPEAPVYAVAAALTDSSVYVLARAGVPDDQGILDVYSAHDCTYAYSVVLPRRYRAMTLAPDAFVFAYEDPVPTVVGLRMSGGAPR